MVVAGKKIIEEKVDYNELDNEDIVEVFQLGRGLGVGLGVMVSHEGFVA